MEKLGDIFIKSWKILPKNWKLFAPQMFMLFFTLILGFLFAYTSGLINYFLEGAKQGFIEFFTENILKIIISSCLFLITSFIIGSGVKAMQYSLIKEVYKKGEISSIKNALLESGDFFWRVVFVRILFFAISIVSITIITLLAITIILIPLAIFLIFSIIAIFLYTYPILFLENASPLNALNKSYSYFKKNPGNTFLVAIISAVITISLYMIPILFQIISSVSDVFSIAYLTWTLTIIYYIISILLSWVSEVWSALFIFLTYKKKF